MKIDDILDEALRFIRSSPQGFVGARSKTKKSAFLSQNNPRELAHHDMFTGHSAEVGYALDRHQDLQNVFNNASFRGIGAEALIHAIKQGAKTLDAFDPFLPGYYKRFGFIVVGRLKFSDEAAPANWNYEKFGRPDVVFMVYRGGPRETIERRIGTFPKYRGEGGYFLSYDDAKRVQRAAALKSP